MSTPGRPNGESPRAQRDGLPVNAPEVDAPRAGSLRSDLRLIADWIAPGSAVLDLGCGDGVLLAGDRSLAVSYQLDLYADGDRTVGSGSVDADFTGLAEDLEGTDAQLTLEDESVMGVTLETVEDDGAEFQIKPE